MAQRGLVIVVIYRCAYESMQVEAACWLRLGVCDLSIVGGHANSWNAIGWQEICRPGVVGDASKRDAQLGSNKEMVCSFKI